MGRQSPCPKPIKLDPSFEGTDAMESDFQLYLPLPSSRPGRGLSVRPFSTIGIGDGSRLSTPGCRMRSRVPLPPIESGAPLLRSDGGGGLPKEDQLPPTCPPHTEAHRLLPLPHAFGGHDQRRTNLSHGSKPSLRGEAPSLRDPGQAPLPSRRGDSICGKEMEGLPATSPLGLERPSGVHPTIFLKGQGPCQSLQSKLIRKIRQQKKEVFNVRAL